MHAKDCLDYQDGPCTCGLEEVLQDEAAEIAAEECMDEA